MTGSPIEIKFHSRWGEKTILKAKKNIQISQTCFCMTACCSNYMYILVTLKWKLEFLPSTVSVNLSVMALPVVPKAEFIFEIMLYITIIFLHESTGSCFKSPIGIIKTHLKVHRSSCFRGCRRKGKFFARNVWWLSTPWSSILRQP